MATSVHCEQQTTGRRLASPRDAAEEQAGLQLVLEDRLRGLASDVCEASVGGGARLYRPV